MERLLLFSFKTDFASSDQYAMHTGTSRVCSGVVSLFNVKSNNMIALNLLRL